MRPVPADFRVCRAAVSRFLVITVLVPAAAFSTPYAVGDIFHLTSGGKIEGELLENDGRHYKIRTVIGSVTVATDAVERIEAAPSPFQQYEERRAQAADTPADQVALAKWCDEQGLSRERLAHLRRAIELDPDYEPARRELGHVRVGDHWVDGRTVVARERPPAAGEAGAGNAPNGDNPQKLAAVIQGTWRRRISAIRFALLEISLDRQVQAGRQKILDIRDPLAIVPLVQVLSEGSPLCRAILVDALRGFPDDVATVNLAAIALADPEKDIRQRAIVELVRRKDSRVTAQFRKALESGNDVLIKRAAEALAALKAREAVPELIRALKARRRKLVEVPVTRYFGMLGEPFGVSFTHIGAEPIAVPPSMAFVNPASLIELERRMMNVTVKRTQVLEALRQITGADFGFETEAWARWYEENKQ